MRGKIICLAIYSSEQGWGAGAGRVPLGKWVAVIKVLVSLLSPRLAQSDPQDPSISTD